MPNWTQQQKNAIEARGGSVLVSAAAGSGKTAVLVERVIGRITDAENPCDADRLLIVTFTKAAASEMKERISANLGERIRRQPENSRLRKQKLLLERAQISTIHSFCSSLVRENFHLLDIPADFRIAEPSELEILRDDAVNEILDEMYEHEGREAFIELVEQVSSEKNDRELSEIILKLFDFISAHPFPEKWLDDRQEMYREGGCLEDTLWVRIIMDYVRSAVKTCALSNAAALAEIQNDAAAQKGYGAALAADAAQYAGILREEGWDGLFAAIHRFQWERLPPLKGYEHIKSGRDAQKEIMKKLPSYVCATQKQHSEDMRLLYPLVCSLFTLVRRFGQRFSEKKREARCVDFSDLEHLAIKLLAEYRDGEVRRTAFAKEVSLLFDEILIDEYQDTNEAQDMIFWAVSRDGENLFMVGDVKQSIYRFRQAMPRLFLQRYQSFQDFGEGFPAKIMLEKNFRSREEVTQTVNFFFSQLMSREVGEISYDSRQRLVHGAEMPQINGVQAEVMLVSADAQQLDQDAAEAFFIAEKIKNMLAQGYRVCDKGAVRKASYRDFCILLRSTKGHAEAFARMLEQCGIPVYSPSSGGFFQAKEVAFMLSLLRIIDNPVQDIPLIAVLLSPVFGFSPDALAEIRLCAPKRPLYSALAMKAQQGDEKCRQFIESVDSLRRLSVTMPVDMLIVRVYQRTGYTDMVRAMKNGDARLANLRLLTEYAKRYEGSGSKGLSGFIRFIDRLAEQKKDLQSASALSENADVVRIMSVHSAKGLEFPVCFVSGLGGSFNRQDQYRNLLVHPELGIAMKLLGSERLNRYNTLPRAAISLEIERESLSEELRILYVAMTRAKEKLILTCCISGMEKKLCKLAEKIDSVDTIPPYVVRSAAGFSDWILLCALRHPAADSLRRAAGAGNIHCVDCPEGLHIEVIDRQAEPDAGRKAEASVCADGSLMDSLKQTLAYTYPYIYLAGIPAKVTASAFAHEEQQKKYAACSRPRFISEGGLTPAEKGTALHRFMQFADYSLAAEDPQKELTRMVHMGYLSSQEGEAVNLEKIVRFFSGELAAALACADEVMREIRFAVEIPASEYAPGLPGHEKILLQGVADCVYRKENKLYVVDYKTDRVKTLAALTEKYSKQVSLYKKAMQDIFSMQVEKCILYSFALENSVEIQC